MKTLRLLIVMAVALMVVFAGGMASAAGDYRGGGHSGGYHRGGGHDGGHGGWGRHGGSRFNFDVVVGSPFWGAPWYYPYYYPYYYPNYYPNYYPYAPAGPSMHQEYQEYIERPRGEPSSRPAGVWYYCPKSKAYYPYVRECPGGWQKVPAQPPPESER